MISQKLHKKISDYVKILKLYVDRLWYPPFVGFLAALDNFIVIIPNDGILISSSMLAPKRWFALAMNVTIGSTLGALVLAALVKVHGLPWILDIYPGITNDRSWLLASEFFENYGLLVVFLVAITPFAQQPAIILASLSGTTLVELTVVIFIGRFVKFLTMAYIGSHAPKMLSRMWGVRGELRDAGVKLN